MNWLNHFRQLHLVNVAFAATLSPEGVLGPVGASSVKLDGALAPRPGPRIHTVVVSDRQSLDNLSDFEQVTPFLYRYRGPGSSFHIIRAATLTQAIERLRTDHQTRWGEIPDYSDVLDRHRDLVGRDWLEQRVLAWLDSSPRSHLVLTAGPGFGKSAFSTRMIRRLGHDCVYHLFNDVRRDPQRAIASLCAQLRRLYGLPRPEVREGEDRSQELPDLLGEVRRSLPKGQRLILWIDGLDEASQPSQPLVPRYLPPGMKVVLTTRPGQPLGWLPDNTHTDTIDLPSAARLAAADNPDDLLLYLERENDRRGLGLRPEFLRELARAANGNFMLAIRYLHDPAELAAWQEQPWRIPHSVEDWLAREWQRLLVQASHEGLREPTVRVVLGLLAVARAPLSREHLEEFLLAAEKAGQKRVGTVPLSSLIDHHEDVLRQAGGFFEPQPPGGGAGACHRFFHESFGAFVLNKLGPCEKPDLHAILAAGCASPLRSQSARDYAAQYRMAHLIEAGDSIGAARYYGSDLAPQETVAASRALARHLQDGESSWVLDLLQNGQLDDTQRWHIAHRFLFELYEEVEGGPR